MGGKLVYLLLCAYMIGQALLPSKFKLLGIPLNGDTILGLVIVVYLAGVIIYKENRIRFLHGIRNMFKSKSDLFFAGLIGLMFLSVIYSVDKKASISESVRFGTYFALYFIIKYELQSEKNFKGLLKLYILISSVVGIIGIIEYTYLKFFSDISTGERIRVASTLENANNMGMFFIMILFPSILLLLNERGRRNKIMYIILSCIFFTNILLSFSRNALIGLVIGCLLIVFLHSKKFVIALSGIAIGASLIPSVMARIKEMVDMAQNSSRLKLWSVALEMIKDHPVLGVGMGNYRKYYDIYAEKFENISSYIPGTKTHAHNAYLKFQSELGVFGLMLFIGFLYSFLISIKKYVKISADIFNKSFMQGYFISMIVLMFMSMIDNFFSAPKVIAYIWIIFALAEMHNYDAGFDVEVSNTGGSYGF